MNTFLPLLRDTAFDSLMSKRIYNVLLIASPYDAFMLEDDGRVDELVFNEYTSLSLRYPPRFTHAVNEAEACALLSERHFELVIVMPNMANNDAFTVANNIKAAHPDICMVVLTPFSKEVSQRMAHIDLSRIDYVFSWLGNAELLIAIIKLMEDSLNAPHDVSEVGTQAIVLVENSVRFYSSALPIIYHTVLEQSREFSKEALNEHLRMLRMRSRPKVLLARHYEEAIALCHTYRDHLLGVITDMCFYKNGARNEVAGYELAQQLREQDEHLPIILQSSNKENELYAKKLDIPFIEKRTRHYPLLLQEQIKQQFGFGPFIVTDPTTQQAMARIDNLRDLQRELPKIPDEVLYHHLEANHLSRFLYSRALFPIAEVLRRHKASQYANMDEARRNISSLISQYRHMKHDGVVAQFEGNTFDEYSQFARIGKGSLGGKGRGLAFMSQLLARQAISHECANIKVPKTVVVCTDVFDAFMESNQLYPIALSNAADSDILAAFEKATLPETLLTDLRQLLSSTTRPLAVRSSSVLEDSHFQPFAGVYATYMIPRTDAEQTWQLLRSAIKAVYASVFFKESKQYLTATQNLIDQEKMAVILQEMVGEAHGTLFFPTLSGVARSFNFYPTENEKPDDGVVSIALGLGKQIVDGGKALCFNPQHPRRCLQTSDARTALKETQRSFFALNLENTLTVTTCNDGYNLVNVPIDRLFPTFKAAPYVFSTYDLRNEQLIAGYHPEAGKAVVTFEELRRAKRAFTDNIARLLQLGKSGMGRDVEIEFAVQFHSPENMVFYLLQIRPMADYGTDFDQRIMDDALQHKEVLVHSAKVLGNGSVKSVQHIIYIRNRNFTPKERIELASVIAEVNARMQQEGKEYVLIGSGRWGSADAALGIPVSWSQISAVRAIVEHDISARHVDNSQGSHFFQNLTSLGVPYFTVTSQTTDSINHKWLSQTAATECYNGTVRIITLQHPLTICIDGKKAKGIIAY